ncbi:hypothetical protein SAMN05421736_104243 [Evansella caseinilytica]|uniref:YhfM-like domain-containing protein n=1 Tax=Evansella caseinilytica TaxID=1503961 RepID=A0A1H3NXK7_9BACI|nr:hypothetical protein [Evansella caseinilytica]SDY93450.1 hypothetical protein SAMN05421736_104243 [Evansella caseinilytica]
MKKLHILLIAVGFILVGCLEEQGKEISEPQNESSPETVTSKMNSLELKEPEEIDIFTKAVSESNKESGIVNMTNPQYQFSIGEETYFLWITEESGTIMNTKDTHTIYSLSSNSVKEIYNFVSKG